MSGILTFVSSGPEATIASSSAPPKESALVAAAKNGDAQAFETLVKRYQRKILAIAVRYTCTRYDGEDVSQQTFQKAFLYLPRFEGKSSFSTWLTRIAINEALMFLRKGRGHREVPIDEGLIHQNGAASRLEILDSGANPETNYVHQEDMRILFAAMHKLRPGLRRAVELRELAELSTAETARRMGVSVAAVKARLFHGRKKLREALGQTTGGHARWAQAKIQQSPVSRPQLGKSVEPQWTRLVVLRKDELTSSCGSRQ